MRPQAAGQDGCCVSEIALPRGRGGVQADKAEVLYFNVLCNSEGFGL